MKIETTYKHIMLIAILLVTTSITAIAQKSSSVKPERVMTPTHFTALKVEGPIEIYISIDKTPQVRIVANEDILNEIEYSQRGQSVNLKWNKTKGTAKGKLVQVFVTMPQLTNLTLEASASAIIDSPITSNSDLTIRMYSAAALQCDSLNYRDIFIEGNSAAIFKGSIAAQMLSISLQSASKISANVNAEKGFLNMSSASKASLNGNIADFTVVGNTASALDAAKLSANKLEVNLTSGAAVKCHIADTAKVNIASAAKLTYTGTPTFLEMNISSGAKIKQNN